MWTYLSAENFKEWNLDRDIGNEEDSIRKNGIVWWERRARRQGFSVEE